MGKAGRAAGRYAIEVVADDDHPMRAADCLVGVGIAIEAGKGWYLPFGHTQEPPPPIEGQQELNMDAPEPLPPLKQLTQATVLQALRPLLTAAKLQRVSANDKAGLLALAEAEGWYWSAPVSFDTSIAGYLIGERAVGVRGLAFGRLGHELVEPKSLLGSGRKAIPFSRTAPGARAG